MGRNCLAAELDAQLPAAPVAALWVTNVAKTTHLPKELRHWTILLDLLGQSALGTKRFMRSHSKGRPNR
jgi:hypothetical protein